MSTARNTALVVLAKSLRHWNLTLVGAPAKPLGVAAFGLIILCDPGRVGDPTY